MDGYERYCKIRDSKGYSDSKIASMTGITKSTFTDWKNGRSKPKIEKLQKIASALDVSVDYLTTGKDTEKESVEGKKYYFNDETAELAQDLFEDSEKKGLAKALRDLSPDDIKLLASTVERLRATNPYG